MSVFLLDEYFANLPEEVDLKEAFSLHDIAIVIIHTYTTGPVTKDLKIIQTLSEMPVLENTNLSEIALILHHPQSF